MNTPRFVYVRASQVSWTILDTGPAPEPCKTICFVPEPRIESFPNELKENAQARALVDLMNRDHEIAQQINATQAKR